MSEHIENHEHDEEEIDAEYDLITLVDDEGEEHDFEMVDALVHGDTEYCALIPIFDDAEEFLQDSAALVIMRIEEENDGEVFLETIEDDDEYDQVSALFVERLSDDFDILEEYDEDFEDLEDID